MNFGDLILKAAAVLSVVAFVEAIRWSRGRAASERIFRYAYHGMTVMLAAASVLLMRAILLNDLRFDYVIGHSSSDLPLLYKVSAFWAGQEGTFLLWALMAALIGYPLLRRRAWEPALAAVFYLPTVAFLQIFMLDPNGNPFRMVDVMPPDGRGLNVLLQDPWMAIHPPVVFLGYAAMTVPAVLALVSLVRGGGREWLGPAIRWSLVGFISLGAGIILGGFWAYKVLGWGGYWGWDPVENASLVPWLVVTGLIHGLLVQNTTGSLRRMNIGLALAGYVLVIYATFLTRSGVLADVSVHSFPPGSLYKILLGVMLFVLAGSVAVFLWKRGGTGKPIPVEAGWPFVLSAVMLIFIVSAAIVAVGTSWPIITSAAMEQPQTMSGPFYNKTNLPLYVILLGLLAAGPFLAWQGMPLRRLAGHLAIPLAAGVVGTGVAVALGGGGAVGIVLFFFAMMAVAANLERFVRMARVRFMATGAALAHMGFALMFLGIVGSSLWGEAERIKLPLGQPVESLDGTYTYRGHIDGTEPQDRWSIEVVREGKQDRDAQVSMFRMPGQPGAEPQIFRRPAIVRSVAKDIYIVPYGLEDGQQHRNLDLGRDEPLEFEGGTLTFRRFDTTRPGEEGHGMEVRAVIDVVAESGEETVLLPMVADQAGLHGTPVELAVFPGVTLLLERMSVEQGRVMVHADVPGAAPPTMVAEISIKPLINVLWAGTVLLLIGCTVAVVRRAQDERRLAALRHDAAPRPVEAVAHHPSSAKKGKKKSKGRRSARRAVGGGAR